MSINNRILFWLAALMVLLLIVGVWNVQRLHEATKQAERAVQNTQLAAERAGAIMALRGDPPLEEQAVTAEPQWASLVRSAAEQADVQVTIQSITPLPPQRIGRTNQERRGANLVLQGLTASGTAKLLHQLSEINPRLEIDSLRLASPSGEGPETKWHLEPVTVTYRVRIAEGAQ